MKHKYLVYALAASVIGLSGVGVAGVVSAHGLGGFGGFGMFGTQTPDQIATRQQAMFDQQAQLLGISVNDVKASWAKGESMQELMKVKNIDQAQVQTRMKDLRMKELKTQLDALVSKGVITQAQADARLQAMQTMSAKAKVNKGMKGGMRGMHF